MADNYEADLAEVTREALRPLDPLTSTAGLPPLPRRIPGGSYSALGQRLAELEDAPARLRILAGALEHGVLIAANGDFPLPDPNPAIDDLRSWADAIEALLR